MRLTLAQLRKFKMPYKFEENLDLKDDLISFEDILDSGLTHVAGVINEVAHDEFEVELNIKVDLILEGAITLARVPFTVKAKAKELFIVTKTDDSSYFMIEGQTLDTKEAVLTNIICNKPMRVVAKGAKFESDIEEADDEEYLNPAFASLKDLL